jgi:putative ABC transport system permease protein
VSWILQDLRRAARLFKQTPWFAAGVVLILALGTGLNSAVLTTAYGILLRPLPYTAPSRLAIVQHGVTLRQIVEWRQALHTADDVAGFATAEHAIRGLGEPKIVRAAFVSPSFFTVLGAQTVAGRTFGGGDASGIVISQQLVDATFGDPARAIGSVVNIAERSFAVLGVLARDVAVPSDATDLWLPAESAAAIPTPRGDARRYEMIVRLKPGVTLDQARDDAGRVAQQLAPTVQRVPVVSLEARLRDDARPVLLALVVGAVLVLLVTCANVASLLLSRTAARERETAMRLALGASPFRVLRTLFVEGLLLAIAGSAAGIGFAIGAVRLLRTHASALVPRLDAVRVDGTVLALALTIAVFVAMLCTLAPGLHTARRGLNPVIRQGGSGQSHAGRRLSGVLVVAQIALSIVVLTAGALLGRTVTRLLAVDAGITPAHVLTMKLALGERTILQAGERRAFVQQLLDAVHALPGVQSVGLGSNLPPRTSQVEMAIQVIEDGGRDETRMLGLVAVRGDYFEALGTHVVAGRMLESSDFSGVTSSVVISRSTAEHLFRGRDAVGQPMPSNLPGDQGKRGRVVGVVEDIRYKGLAAPMSGAVYVPWDNLPLSTVHLVVRTTDTPLAFAAAVQSVVHQLDPGIPIADVRSLDDALRSSIADRRLHAVLAISFSLLGFAVAVVGLVAVMSRTVVHRRREFAIRAALGATPTNIIRLVMGDATRLAIPGLITGVALALIAARGLAARLFGVTPYDPVTYIVVATVAGVVALLSCLGPATRAVSADPSALLRSE